MHKQLSLNVFKKSSFLTCFYFPQKLKDVAFPQAEILKKALLKRFDQEYAQYLAKKVSTQKCNYYIQQINDTCLLF